MRAARATVAAALRTLRQRMASGWYPLFGKQERSTLTKGANIHLCVRQEVQEHKLDSSTISFVTVGVGV